MTWVEPAGKTRNLRDRFLTFAFAAAELLVEADPEGCITFAAGAFRSRLGEPPEAFLGRSVHALIAPEDRTALGLGLGSLSTLGRLPPVTLRLNNAQRSEVTVSGLAPPGAEERLFLTFGPRPGPPPAETPSSPESLAHLAEARLRDGAPGALGLIELPRGSDVALARNPALRSALVKDLNAAGEIAPGRFGLLTSGEDALFALVRGAEATLASHGIRGHIATRTLALEAEGLTVMQATRALRHALAAFSRDGVAGADKAGTPAGISGLVARLASDASAVRRVIAARRFDLAFQPIADLATRATHHYEALLRPPADLPDTLSLPDGFVRCTEAVGMTEALDFAVTAEVLKALASSPGTHIAVNLSGLSVQNPSFRADLLALLDSAPATARRLMVEITESAEIEDEAEAVRTLDTLRDRGIGLCLDDFGAGAAAFRYLRAFKVDWVKVDGLYVANAVRSERDRAFIASMVDLATAVGAKVVAERIETEADAAAMRALGVQCGQGWYYGRPGSLPRPVLTGNRRGQDREVWA